MKGTLYLVNRAHPLPSERRSEILHLLCKRRHETAINLAVEFGVSARAARVR